jgi:16S rRNA (guanine1207-N2)-methyltransferase
MPDIVKENRAGSIIYLTSFGGKSLGPQKSSAQGKPVHELDYYRPRQLELSVSGRKITVWSKPGLPDWQGLLPSAALIAGKTALQPGENAVLFGSGHGAAAVSLAGMLGAGRLTILEHNLVARRMTQRTLQANWVENAALHPGIRLLPEGAASFDAAVIDLPKGRALTRRGLLEAWHLLRPQGRLFIAGANREGIQTAIKDAAGLFESLSVLGYKKGSRLARLRKGEPSQLPPWVNEPGIAPASWREIDIVVDGEHLKLRSLPGVFSYDELDPGTRLLLENIGWVPGEPALDFGCGSGVIGLFLKRRGAALVDLVDVDLLAVESARENIRLNGLEAVEALPSDVLEGVADRGYSLIASNPPFHAGKQVDYQAAEAFILHGSRLLSQNGRLVLVANRFIRYDRLMQQVFSKVETLAETSRFHVLQGWKVSKAPQGEIK